MSASTIVIDAGSGMIRAGYAGDMFPRYTSEPRFVDTTGKELSDQDRVPSCSYETNFDRVFRDVFRVLGAPVPGDRAVLVVVSNACPEPFVKGIQSALVNRLRITNFNICTAASCTLLHTGLDSCLIVDIGRIAATCIPVFSGHIIEDCIGISSFGVQQLKSHIGLHAELPDHNMVGCAGSMRALYTPPYNRRSTRDSYLNRLLFSSSVDPHESADKSAVHNIHLRDGSQYRVPDDCIEEGLEIFCEELQLCLTDVVKRLPLDAVKPVFRKIVVVGGGSEIGGMDARVRASVSRAVSNYEWSDECSAVIASANSSWRGASILASLRSFPKGLFGSSLQ